MWWVLAIVVGAPLGTVVAAFAMSWLQEEEAKDWRASWLGMCFFVVMFGIAEVLAFVTVILLIPVMGVIYGVAWLSFKVTPQKRRIT